MLLYLIEEKYGELLGITKGSSGNNIQKRKTITEQCKDTFRHFSILNDLLAF